MPSRQESAVDAAADPMPRLRQTLRAFIGSRVRDSALADDLTQETLLRVETRLQTLRSRDRLDGWVFRIARNTIADHFRNTRETEEFDEAAHGPLLSVADNTLTPEDEALSTELRDYVRSVVDRLPPLYREAIRLIELEGLSQVELARRLGLSVSATKSRVQRGRAMLRKEMERCCHWETDRYGTVLAVQPRGSCTCGGSDSAGCQK
jgi:RNA polymerase sigma-70 factor (ECF subfamily)